jgi:hypothetical protein
LNSSDPIINNISRSKSKRNLNQNLITNFATLSNDIKKNLTQSIYNKTLETYPDISIDKSNKFQKNSAKIITTKDNQNELVLKIKQENFELKQIIISKNKEIENLKAIIKEILRSQDSKNEVYYF